MEHGERRTWVGLLLAALAPVVVFIAVGLLAGCGDSASVYDASQGRYRDRAAVEQERRDEIRDLQRRTDRLEKPRDN